jgi:hypothetical protein
VNAPARIATSLRNAPRRPLNREELDPLRERAWQEQGLICLYPDEIANDWLKAGLTQLAAKMFGKRMKR